MDTVKENGKGMEGAERQLGQEAWHRWQLMERKNAGDNANEQHNMQLV